MSLVTVQLSMEALCPDCINYSTSQVSELMAKASSIASLTVLPFGNASPSSSSEGWDCQHGVNECIGNMYIACAVEHFDESDAENVPAWYPFYECMEASDYNKDRVLAYNTTDAIACAGMAAIDWNVISECAGENPSVGSADDGNALMKSIMLATPNHTYVPWVVINGETVPDSGQGYPSGDLLTMVCEAYTGDNLPAGCP
jgi:interferon gamma-inducible protein 30